MSIDKFHEKKTCLDVSSIMHKKDKKQLATATPQLSGMVAGQMNAVHD